MSERLFVIVCILLLAGCGVEQDVPRGGGALLLSDVTLGPTTPAPTRILSPTPTPTPFTIPVSTSELDTVLNVITLEADFLLVTPTLPPSRTPTQTPTATATFTITPPPTMTFPPLPTLMGMPLDYFPPPVGADAPFPGTAAAPLACQTAWFFIQPRPAACPLNPPLVSGASFQQFEKGFMLWVQQHGAIYVLYDSANFPRWQVFQDAYQEGMPETDPALNNPPPYTWQPRRGFGLVWRSFPDLRQRLGWAVIEWETPFTIQMQTGADGLIYMSEPRGGVFSLVPDGSDWKRYEG